MFEVQTLNFIQFLSKQGKVKKLEKLTFVHMKRLQTDAYPNVIMFTQLFKRPTPFLPSWCF